MLFFFFFLDKLYTSQNVCQSAIYNACILFCDCLKRTKQITQNAQRRVQASYNDRYHKTEPFSYLRAKNIYNMYTGLTASFLHLSLFKNIVTFLCWFCFFSVQHFAARKQGVHVSPEVILLISATGVTAESMFCPEAFCVRSTFLFLMQYIKESHLQATKTQLKVSVVRTKKMRSLTTLKKKKKKTTTFFLRA